MNNFIFHNNSGKKAFTLLEMLIVLSLVGILLSTVFSILFVVLRQQVRIYRITETRRQGDAILNFMKEKIVRSTEIRNPTLPPLNQPQCVAAGSTYTPANPQNFVVVDAALSFRFYLVGTNLVYNQPPSAVTTPLNNNRVTVTAFTIECIRKAINSTPIVQFSYTVTFPAPNPADRVVILNYRSKVKLR